MAAGIGRSLTGEALLEIDMPSTSQSSRDKSSGGSLSEDDDLPEITKALHNFAQWAFGQRMRPAIWTQTIYPRPHLDTCREDYWDRYSLVGTCPAET